MSETEFLSLLFPCAQPLLSRPPDADAEARRMRRQLQKAKAATADPFKRDRLLTPLPVSGRQHMQLQTEEHLIELTEHAKSFMAETQTEPWMDRPSTPIFRPHREEVHASTQILDGDLFAFDEEVVPILEVIVGKVLEQSITEVLEEEELAALKKQQDEYERARMLELIEVQRLEAAERRRSEEIQRRRAQAEAWHEVKRTAYRKMLAMDFAATHRRGRSQLILRQLAESANLFMHPKVGAVCVSFWPSLLKQTTSQVCFPAPAATSRRRGVPYSLRKRLLSDYAERDRDVERMVMEKQDEQRRVRLEQLRFKAERRARIKREAEEREEMQAVDTLEAEREWEIAEAARLEQEALEEARRAEEEALLEAERNANRAAGQQQWEGSEDGED
ncbi:radial spoke protein 3 protein [Besnoitia besnoiti]|uniref:Radial spoke protein 3 protein n=1 Tax=Besnoitia besnoiti TaxID=94643 RepID=A0A2A9M3X7_BESBE|nr:radial spoke protein 3 protein [Besnoitia besnoiti]PFH32665.1 radial spoke protein 3 protein [Besnoitia besnoiti]